MKVVSFCFVYPIALTKCINCSILFSPNYGTSNSEVIVSNKSKRKNHQKNPKGKSRISFGIVLLGMLVVTALLLLISKGTSNKPIKASSPVQQVTSTQTVQNPYDRVVEEYFKIHGHADEYWLFGNEEFKEQIARTKKWGENAEQLLSKYVGVSVLAREIRERFTSLHISEFRDGIAVTNFISNEEAEEHVENPGSERKLEVSIVPIIQRQKYQGTFPSNLYYRSEWGAVMVTGVVIPDVFLAALLYHEMGHALRHRQGAPSSTAPANSDIWIWEEIEMHELEHHVLDSAVGGQLSKLYDEILARRSSDTDLISRHVKIDDLIRFDQMFNLEKTGRELVGVYLAQFETGLRLRAVNIQKLDEGSKRKKKIEVYRQIAGKS